MNHEFHHCINKAVVEPTRQIDGWAADIFSDDIGGDGRKRNRLVGGADRAELLNRQAWLEFMAEDIFAGRGESMRLNLDSA